MFDEKTKVLVIDDMLTMRKIVSKICVEIGLKNVTTANDGKEAWDALNNATEPFGLIISDWNMPNMTGLDLLKLVRGSDKFKNLPFVLVTAEAEQQQIVQALTAGVDNYVVKPFTPDILKEKLKAVEKKRAAKKA